MVFQEEAHVLDRRRALEQVDRHGMAHPAARLDLGVDLLAELLHRDGAETGRLGSETILDQVDLARHPAAGRLRMRIAAYVQFQEQRLVLRVSHIAAQAFGRDRENRLERERDLVREAPGFKASARRTDAFRAGSDIVRWGRIFISEEELQHCCNGFEAIWITLVFVVVRGDRKACHGGKVKQCGLVGGQRSSPKGALR